jgi:hypothetical protein
VIQDKDLGLAVAQVHLRICRPMQALITTSCRPDSVTAMNHPEFPDKSITADAEWRSAIDVE